MLGLRTKKRQHFRPAFGSPSRNQDGHFHDVLVAVSAAAGHFTGNNRRKESQTLHEWGATAMTRCLWEVAWMGEICIGDMKPYFDNDHSLYTFEDVMELFSCFPEVKRKGQCWTITFRWDEMEKFMGHKMKKKSHDRRRHKESSGSDSPKSDSSLSPKSSSSSAEGMKRVDTLDQQSEITVERSDSGIFSVSQSYGQLSETPLQCRQRGTSTSSASLLNPATNGNSPKSHWFLEMVRSSDMEKQAKQPPTPTFIQREVTQIRVINSGLILLFVLCCNYPFLLIPVAVLAALYCVLLDDSNRNYAAC